MRERIKEVTMDGRTFQLKKLPAARSYAILVEIMTKAVPTDLLLNELQDFLPLNLTSLPGRQMMSMEEMELLQLKLLAAVSEQLKSGWVPVVDNQGNFQVEDLEDNMLLFGELLVKVVEFQYADFFTALLSRLGITMEEPETFMQKSEAFLQEQQMSANTFSAL